MVVLKINWERGSSGREEDIVADKIFIMDHYVNNDNVGSLKWFDSVFTLYCALILRQNIKEVMKRKS